MKKTLFPILVLLALIILFAAPFYFLSSCSTDVERLVNEFKRVSITDKEILSYQKTDTDQGWITLYIFKIYNSNDPHVLAITDQGHISWSNNGGY